ncbi:MAG TPA: DUF6335 family protein [Vicinamibacterales bacterium]|nr:DUF6335 family protein [Vicinamibacterales bacterium]
MAKRKAPARSTRGVRGRKAARSAKRPTRKAVAKTTRKSAQKPRTAGGRKTATKARRRNRRSSSAEVVPTPPSSLDLKRRGTAARSGRAEMAVERARRRNLSPELAGGDADADLESAYFTGDETAGGDNPTPDQDVVDDIGRAVGVEYQDNEELGTTDKVTKRDRHRWELDPASAEDYKDRK